MTVFWALTPRVIVRRHQHYEEMHKIITLKNKAAHSSEMSLSTSNHTASKPTRLPCDQHRSRGALKPTNHCTMWNKFIYRNTSKCSNIHKLKQNSSDDAPLSCLLDAAHFNIHQGRIKSDYNQLQTNYTSSTNGFTIFGCSFVLISQCSH